jgi:rRNA maturation endonuclease Nob1
MSPLAWMVFVILIFLCIVLCWIPFVSMKRDMEICPRCGHNHVRGIRKKG